MKILKGVIRSHKSKGKQYNNQRKNTLWQTINNKTLYKTLKIKQHELRLKDKQYHGSIDKRTTIIYKTLHRKHKIEQHRIPLKFGVEPRYSGRVSSSCSTCGIRRFSLVKKPVICHKWERGEVICTTNST